LGRDAGWLACYGGIAGGADFILVPEKPIEAQKVVQAIKTRHSRGRDYSIVVVAEGAKFAEGEAGVEAGETPEQVDSFGHKRLGGIGDRLAKLIESQTGFETRATILGHIQRGGSPTAFDRVLATRFGVKAAQLVNEKKFGRMVSLQGSTLTDVAIEEATGTLKTLDMELYGVAEVFFG